MNEVLYRYSEGDLLENPQTYSYSPFEGKEFVKAYFSSRQKATQETEKKGLELIASIKDYELGRYLYYQDLFGKHLSKNLKKIKPRDSVEKYNINNPEILYDLITLDSFETFDVMQLITKNLAIKGPDISLINIINKFIKKFELNKRLYDTYTNQFKPSVVDYRTYENYALFSLILEQLFQKTKNFKFINTSLKVNDTLVSNISNLENSLQCLLTNATLNFELEEIKNLFKSKEVEI